MRLKRNVFFSSVGKGSARPAAEPPFRRKCVTTEVLIDANETAEKSGKRNGKAKELGVSHATEVFRQIARMINDDHGSLSAYVADFMRMFDDAKRCTIYLAAERTVNSQEKKVLEHRLTVVRDGNEFRTRNVDDSFTITDGRSSVLVAFREVKPSIIDYDSGIKVAFRDLDRNDKRYTSYRYYKERDKSGMKAYIPMLYRRSPIGVIVLEGGLGIAGCGSTREESGAFSVAAAAAAGAQIVFQLMHKFDGVTKLKRRQDFDIELEDAIEKLNGGKLKSVFVLLIDLDNFKMINDRLGHLKGDEMLYKVAQKIMESVRTEEEVPEGEDARKPDRVARWGGEEYVALLSGDVSPKEALKIAKRINQSVASLSEKGPKVTCSIGAVDVGAVLKQCESKSAKKCREFVFKKCDDLMYRAKRSGRNRTFFTEVRDGKIVEVEYKNGSG